MENSIVITLCLFCTGIGFVIGLIKKQNQSPTPCIKPQENTKEKIVYKHPEQMSDKEVFKVISYIYPQLEIIGRSLIDVEDQELRGDIEERITSCIKAWRLWGNDIDADNHLKSRVDSVERTANPIKYDSSSLGGYSSSNWFNDTCSGQIVGSFLDTFGF